MADVDKGRALGKSIVSKQRYAAFKAELQDKHKLEAPMLAEVLRDFQRIMHFDPDATTYTEAQKQHVRDWRTRRQTETGKTSYELEGGRTAYVRRKALKQQQQQLKEG
jgi:hypothetical protein